MVKIVYKNPNKQDPQEEHIEWIKKMVGRIFGDEINIEKRVGAGSSYLLEFSRYPKTSFKSFILRRRIWGNLEIGTFSPEQGIFELEDRKYEDPVLKFAEEYEKGFRKDVTVNANYRK